MRVEEHPILGQPQRRCEVTIFLDGRPLKAMEGEPVAAALIAAGIRVFRYTEKRREPRCVSCALGRCNDCVMVVNGIPNTRTCVTPVEDGMTLETQHGIGSWRTEG
jgi:predicted molibdopterin-dependent oxidoreductase YjgC